MHDGFFLRVTLGFAILYANIEPRFVGAAERNLFTSGPAWSFELGGTPLRGLAIGPLYYGSVSFSLLGDRTKPGSMTDHYRLHALGLFAAWFPSQTKGLELGGTIMWAPLQVAIQEISGASVRTSSTYLSGISPGVSAGYTGWISPNGALGVLFRVAMGWHASDDASATSFASMLLLNFLYH